MALTSGQSYPYMHPYCSWSGASDGESGLYGYYVYFGTNPAADPATDGNLQAANSYVVNTAMTSGNYYLRIKARDIAGNNAGAAADGFTYVYNGVSPPQTLNKTTTADFTAGTLSNVSASDDQFKLSSKAGFWKEGRLTVTPATIGYGGSIVYKASVGKLYVARGNNTATFWEYDIATDTWTAKSSTGLGTIYYGGMIVNGPGNYIYAMRGGGFNSFYRYDITNDGAGWVDADGEDTPTAFSYGGFLLYDGSRYIYAFRGNSDDVFYRFDPQTTADGQWDQLANANFGYPDQTPTNTVYDGGSLAYDGDNTIYAIQGNTYVGGFAKYSISGNSWTPITKHLPMSPGNGAFLTWDSTTNYLYYLPGISANNMFKYNPQTETWGAVTSGPATFAYGAAIQPINGTFYVLRGANTTSFYKYSVAKDYWYLPTFNLFGPNWFGTSYFTVYYGAGIVKGDGNNFYATRGYYDNRFVKYDPTTGAAISLAYMPAGSYSGGSLVYVSTENAIYAMVGDPENTLFKYNISTNSWSEIITDLPPAQAGYGASMVFDGTRYIYYARGANTTSWYRYDMLAGAGSRWSAALPATGLAGFGYGSELVYKDGFLYSLRGQNVNPNPFYKFDTSALPGGSWTSLNSVSAAVYNDGFLIDGFDGYLYASPAGNNATYGNDWWRFNISTGLWSQIADLPATVYVGGSGASNGSNQIYAFAGPGTNSWADGLYTFTTQTANSSFEENGSYTSESLDLTSVYAWGNMTVNYAGASNTIITVETQSSANGADWSSWQAASQEKTKGNTHEFAINAPVARYLKTRLSVTSGDGVLSPTISDYSVNYYQDTIAPTNPTALSSAKSQEVGGVDITSGNWYNHAAPYFSWPAVGQPNAATDNAGGSGVAGYYVYYGTDPAGVPLTLGAYQTALTYTGGAMTSGNTYYLRLQTKDNAGNTQGTVWDAFTYKYDTGLPNNPSTLTVNPVGYTNIDDYDFTISADASDSNSGLLKYQYRTGGDGADVWTDFDPVLSTTVTIPNAHHLQGQYQEGANQFYLRVVDNAGNASGPMNIQYYFGNASPSPPQNVTASDPNPNTVNSFSFHWDAPVAYIGDVNKIVYYYSINAVPTEFNTNSTSVKAVGPSAFATQKGPNIFYVVAKDEANNINWDSYGQVTFTANTSAPGAPTDIQASDISNKEGNEYRLVISWLAPAISDPENFNGYDVYSSTSPNSGFEKIANTSGTAYVHVDLAKDSTHYYYVVSVDKTGNASAPSDTATAIATGRYTKPPDLVTNPSVVAKATSAKVTWSTSREANSVIEYGTTNELGRAVGNPQSTYVTAHEVNLANLAAGTTYFYKAVFTDPDGNQGNSEIGSFITAPAPAISGLKIEDIALSSMLITWDSNVPSYGQISYGEGANTSMAEKEDAYYITHHVIKIKDLKSDTTYSIQVKAQDAEANTFTSDLYTAQTLALPKVSEVKVENKTEVDTPTMLISYKTNVDTTTLIRYTSEGGTAKEYITSDYAKEHNLELTDLLPAKPYSLSITGRDHYGNEAEAQTHQITTLSDTMPPKVLKAVERKKVVGEGENAEAQLTIKLTSNEPSTMVIEASKGIGSSDFNIKSNEDPLNTEHTVIIKLGGSTVPYSYRVRLKDASGNEVATDVKTLVVARANKSALEYILSIFTRSFGWIGQLFK